MNEEIWDLLCRKNMSVDLAFHRVQEPLIHGISSLVILVDPLVKEMQSAKTMNAREFLTHVMDRIALLGHAQWKLNMKQREIIKRDLNFSYTRLCKEEIKSSTKLFGDDLPKNLKEMSDVSKTSRTTNAESYTHGTVYSSKASNFRSQRSKPYDRPLNNGINVFKHRPLL